MPSVISKQTKRLLRKEPLRINKILAKAVACKEKILLGIVACDYFANQSLAIGAVSFKE